MTDDLVTRLSIAAKERSDISRQMAEAKSLRQDGNTERRTDLYMWTKPEDTLEGRAAAEITRLKAVIAAKDEALDAECPTERGDRIAAEMREHYEANKGLRYRECNADNLMLGLLNIAWKHIAPRTNNERIDTMPGLAERLKYERRILALEVALTEARRWVQAAKDDRDTGTQPGNACFNALQVIDAALTEATPTEGEGA